MRAYARCAFLDRGTRRVPSLAITRTSFRMTVRQESWACPGRGGFEVGRPLRESPSGWKASLKWGMRHLKEKVSLDWGILLLPRFM